MDIVSSPRLAVPAVVDRRTLAWQFRRRGLVLASLTHVLAPASAALVAAAFAPPARAQTTPTPTLPQGGVFTAGEGAIAAANGAMTVTQASNRGVIDWRSFSIGANGHVTIRNGAGATLNRVTGGELSRIDGQLTATGSVYLINPNGIVVGGGGRILTGGSFVASTRDIADGAFMAGGAMTAAGNGAGTVVNQGSIVARDGDVVLIGRSVVNEGGIDAANGTATLAAANTVLLTTVGGPAGIYVAPDAGADGAVSQSGRIAAAAAALKAAGGDIYTLAGNRTGLIAATGTATIDGQVWLTAPNGQVSIEGTVSAGNHDGSGGGIVANGRAVAIGGGATLAATGTRGGSVMVGISRAGAGDLAERTSIADGATILAGGPAGGGLVETSGHHVVIGAATIAAGKGGTWLVDPVDLTIDAAAAATVAASLDAGTNVIEQTSASGASGAGVQSPGSGDLTVAAPIRWTGSGTLTLDAYHDLNLNAAIVGGGGLVGSAGNAVSVRAGIAADTVALTAGTGALTLGSGTSVSAANGITLATGGAFVNNAGAAALSAGSGRWLVYSANPANDADGGLTPDFYQYAAAPGAAAVAAGNGRLFALAPTLAVTLSGAVAKNYDGTTAASFGAAASVAGLVNADTASVTGRYADKNVGTGIAVTASSVAVAHNGIAVYGYAGTSPSVTAATGRIDRAALVATIVGTPTKTYNGTTTAALSAANYAFSGFAAGEGASVNQASTVAYDSADAGARTVTAGLSPTNFAAAAGTSLSNYILPTSAAGAGRIDRAPLLITGVLATGKTYDRTTTDLLDTGNAGLYGIIGGDSVALVTAGATGSFATANAGSNIAVATSGFTLTGGKAGNYALVQPTGLTATIARAPVTVGGVSAASKGYDGNAAALLLTGGATLAGVIAGDTVALNGASASGSFARADADAGIAVTASGFALTGGDAANYALSQPTGLSADITRRSLSVALTGSPTKTYNGADNAVVGTADFALSGFVAGQSATIGQTSTARYATANAGAQGVTVTLNPSDYVAGAGTKLSNYALPTSVAGTGTIQQAPLTIAIAGNPTKTYDGTAAATLASGNYRLSGFLAGEGATVTRTAGSYDSANAGARTVTAALTAGDFAAQGGTLLSNYLLPTLASGYGTIDPAALAGSIRAGITGNPTKTYDGTTLATLTTANFALTGFAAGEGASVTQTVGAYSSKDAGVQRVVANLATSDFVADQGTNLANYTLPGYAYGTGTILQAVLTASIAGDPTKVYNGTTSAALTAANVTVAGLASGEGLVISPATSASYDSRNAGARTVTASFSATDIAAQGGTLLSNYVLPTSASGAGTITLAPLTILGVTAADRAYDTTAAAVLRTGDARLFGAVAGDAITLSTGAAAGSFATANAGNALAVTATGFALTGGDSANYRLLQPTGLTATIARAGVSLTGVAARNKVYDATNTGSLDSAGASLSGVFGTDAGQVALDASGAVASFGSVNVGNDLRVTAGGFALTGAAAGNYALAQPGGLVASITPAPLTALIVGNPTKTYDGSTSTSLTAANYNLVGFVAGQGASVPQSATAHYLVADAGVQGITSTLVSSDFRANAGTNLSNYLLPTAGNGSGTIAQAPLTVRIVGDPTKSYDATTTASLTSANYVLGGFIGSQSGSVTQAVGSYAAADAGSRGVTATLAGGDYAAGAGTRLANYLLPTVAVGTGTITRASLQVTGVTGTNRAYTGGRADVLGVAGAGVAGLFGTDTVTLDSSAATGLFASKNVGTGIGVTASGFTIGGGQSANYTLAQPVGLVADITQAALTLTGVTRVYNQTTGLPTVNAAYAFTGTYAGDAVGINASGATGSYADRNVGTGKAVSVSGLALTGADAGNYAIPNVVNAAIGSITKAPLGVGGVVALDKVYDATRTATLDNANAGLTGLFTGDAVTLGTGSATGLFASKNVGAGKAVSLTGYAVSGADAGNYTLVQPTGVTAAITPNPGISLIAIYKTYDGTTILPTLDTAYWLNGVLPGDTVTVAAAGLSGGYADKNAANGIAVNVSGITLAGPDGANYSTAPSISNVAIGNITTRALSAGIAGNPTKTYDGTAAVTLAAGNYTISGFVTGESATITQTSGSYSSANAGGRTITANLAAGDFAAAGGTLLSNYLLPTTATGGGTIAKRTLTISGVSANDKTYNGTFAAALTVSGAALQNLVPGDAGSVALGTVGAAGLFASKNVGTGIAVTASGFTITGAKAANYNLTQPTGLSASINQAMLNLVGISRMYTAGVAATGAGVTYTLGGVVGGDTVSLATGGLSGSFADKNVGTAKSVSLSGLALTGGSAGNYAIAASVSNAAIGTITAAPLTVTGAVAVGKTYDGSTAATINNAASTVNGVLGSDSLTLNAPTAGTFASANAGSQAVAVSGSYTVSGSDAGNYVVTQPTGLTATIAPKTLTAAVVGTPTKTYDGTIAATLAPANYALTGFVGSQGATVNHASGSYAAADAGSQTVSVTLAAGDFAATGGALLSNYVLPTTASGAGTINQRALTVAIQGNPTKTYDATTAATLAAGNYLLTGFAGGQGGSVTKATGSYAVADAGSRTVTTSLAAGDFVAAGGTNLANYLLPTLASGTGTIAKRGLTVAITGTPTRAYDGTTAATLAASDYALTGFIGGQGAAITQTTGSYASANAGSTAVTATLAAGAFTANGGTTLANYLLPTAASGTGTITPKAVTAAIVGTPTKAYDGTVAATLTSANYLLSGFVAGQGASVTRTGASYAAADAGSRTVTASLAAGDFAATGGTLLSNYLLPTGASGAGLVNRRALTAAIIATPAKTYDATTAATLAAGDVTLAGFVAGQGASVGPVAGSYAAAGAGSRAVTASLAAGDIAATGGTNLSNYLLPTSAAGTGTIAQRVLTAAITATPTKTYDGTATATLAAGDYAFGNFVAGQGASVTRTDGSYAGADAGSRGVTASFAAGDLVAAAGTDLANYLLPTSASGTGFIVRRVLTAAITGTPAKTYDGTTVATLAASDYALSGFVAGQGASIGRASGSYAGADAGSQAVTAMLSAGDFTASGGTNLANYALPTSAVGTGSIAQRALFVAVTGNPTKTYDATTAATLGTGDYTLTGLVAGEGASVTRTVGSYAGADAGVRTVTVALSTADFAGAAGTSLGNYLLPTVATGAGTIAQRSLVASITATPTKTYDGTTVATLAAGDYTLSGLVAGQSATLTATAGYYAIPDAGSRGVTASLTAGDFAAGAGTDLANYLLPTSAVGTGTITARALTAAISGTPTRSYDGTTAATLTPGDYTLAGFVAGQGASVTQGSGTYAAADAGSTGVTALLSGGDFVAASGTSLVNYLLPTMASGTGTITPRALAAAIGGTPTKTYDGTATALLTAGDYSLTGFVAGQGATVTQTAGSYAAADAGGRGVVAQLSAGDFVLDPGTSAANYVLPTSAAGTGTIAQRLLAIAITGTPAKTYDGTTAATLTAADYSLSGFVAGQGASVTATAGQYAVADAGSRGVTVALATGDLVAGAGTDLANYLLPASAVGTGTITPRALTAAIAGTPTRSYDGTTSATLAASDYSLTGFVAGQGASVTQTVGSYAAADAGSRGVVAGLSAGDFALDPGTSAANYVLPTSAAGTGTIDRRVVAAAITGTPAKTYDGTTAATLAAADYSLSGFVAGQGASVGQTFASYAGKDAGSRGVTAILAGGDFIATGGTDLANYLLPTVAAGTGSIAQRLLAIAITGAPTRTYDGTTTATLAAGDYTLTGFVAGEGAAVTQGRGSYASADAGSRAVSASLSAGDFAAASGTTLANYVVPASAAGVGTIERRSLEAAITATPTKIYDGTTAVAIGAAGVTLTGFVAGENAGVGALSGSFAGSDAGRRGVTAAVTAGDVTAAAGTSLANYVVPVSAAGMGSIGGRTLTATITGTPAKTYDGTTAAVLAPGDYTLSGFVAGQGGVVTGTAGTYDSADAGSRTLVATIAAGDVVAGGGTSLSNYLLPVAASGTGTITPRALTAAIVATPTRVADGTTAVALAAGDVVLGGFVAGQGATVLQTTGRFDGAAAGEQVVTTTLGAGVVAANVNTLLANYAVPASASGVGLLTPPVAADTGPLPAGAPGVGLPTPAVVADTSPLPAGAPGVGLPTPPVVTDTSPLPAGAPGVGLPTPPVVADTGSLPAGASGVGLPTPAVVADTGSLHAAIASNLAVRRLADADAIAGMTQRVVLGATLGRTYIPYPAPSALSSWQTNGFAPLPSVVALAAPDADDALAMRTAAPIINSTQQIMLQGGADKAWRIVLPPLTGSTPATTPLEQAR